MPDECDDDELTIDHLIGIPCILNRSIEVEIRLNTKKDRLELCAGAGGCLVIDKVTDVVKDGSYVVTLLKPDGKLVTESAQLINKSFISA